MKPVAAKTLSLISLTIACTCAAAPGDVVLQPVAVSTDMGEPYFSAINVINQSGLSTGYTSLVTDFNTYLASAPTAITGYGGALWGSTPGVRSGHFDFDLGGTYTVSAMALWTIYNDPSTIRQFNILLDDNAAFTSPDYIGSFTTLNSVGDGFGNTGAELFTFAATPASFVRLEILNTWDVASYAAAINEAAFSVAPVPEPSTLALLGLGTAGLLAYRRRQASR